MHAPTVEISNILVGAIHESPVINKRIFVHKKTTA